MTADVREHVLFFLYGTGGNGKSVFLNTVESCFGPDYGMKAPRGLLMAKKETHPTELADLAGKRFISCIEAEDGHRLAESLVKEMTGGDGIRARRMREDFWQFKPTHKIWLAANHKPRIRGTDNGIWRRIRLVPFTVSIPEDQQDKELPAKLEAELPGILNWALLGCLEWQQNGLAAPDVVNRATAEYREEMDLVGGFIEECCIIAQCHKARAVDLYGAYQRWAEQAGEHPASQRAFGTALAARGFERKSSNGTWYLGIGMATAAGNETEPFT
jgi:putative DNA primase/helicase